MAENASAPAHASGAAGRSVDRFGGIIRRPSRTILQAPATQEPLTLADLAHRPMWVGWRTELRGGKKTKVPYDPVTGAPARSNDPKSWATLAEAEAWAIENGGSVGLMFAPVGDNLHMGGIDLDTCRNPETGDIEPWAQEVIDRLRTYAEVSPSETGVKLFVTYALADKPEIDRLFDGKHGRAFKIGDSEHPPGIEVYIVRSRACPLGFGPAFQ
jgi:hypothetical protein